MKELFPIFFRGLAAYCLLASASVSDLLGEPILKEAQRGTPALKSIQVISFAPGGVLLVGDGRGQQIVAIATKDTAPIEPVAGKTANFQGEIASRLGTTVDGVEIVDIAVNPASGRTYVAVRKQDDKSHLIVTVDKSGEPELLDLDEVDFVAIKLRADDVQVNLITDVAWADDRLLAAGRSNETFASSIFSISAPLIHGASTSTFSAETYHVSHRRWETKAPMSVIIPYKEGGKTYIVGAFSCTPVVKYPIDSLQSGAKVKGTSVLELGSGNRPIDMFLYKKGGKQYVLSNTFRFHHERRPFGPSPYWTVKFERSILGAADDVNEAALQRLENYKPATDRVSMVAAFHGVMHMDKLGEGKAVVLRQANKGVDLEVLELP
jgi:hypothetical protein